MKYSDLQRVERISATTKKLLDYLAEKQITREMILEQEPLRWTITTPLYNIGEHSVPCFPCSISPSFISVMGFLYTQE